MEINSENKEIYLAAIQDYKETYKDKFSRDQLDKNAVKFAIRELIYKKVQAKDYHIITGNMGGLEEHKLYDVILPFDMHFSEFKEFAVILKTDGEEFQALYVKHGDGDMTTDKVYSRTFYLD